MVSKFGPRTAESVSVESEIRSRKMAGDVSGETGPCRPAARALIEIPRTNDGIDPENPDTRGQFLDLGPADFGLFWAETHKKGGPGNEPGPPRPHTRPR